MNAVATPNSPAASTSRRVQGRADGQETTSSTNAALSTRSRATVAGRTSSNRLMAIVAPVYWAMPEMTNSASGEADSTNLATPVAGS